MFAGLLPLVLILAFDAQAGVSPEMQQAIRANTFEVVMKKPEVDPVTYEKALPLDLLPFHERTDKYRSVGTAFSLGHNTYVTAAHVINAAIDSQYGMPELRASDGTVYAIDRITRYSMHEDFVVFSLQNDPAPIGLSVNREPKIDDPVLAVGNALGEGIVIRDGLYTSATDEDQDGLWKWIRFSAAASPGNSGGPLLDGNGKVIGIVIGKSPNENLNYSLPIGRALDGDERKAQFDQRVLTQLPFISGTNTYKYRDSFALPLNWPAFAKAYQAVLVRHIDESRALLIKAYSDTMFPRGPGSDSLLFDPEPNGFNPILIMQQADGAWGANRPEYTVTDLSGDGSVSAANVSGATLLRLVRSNGASDDAFYADSKAFMDLALKALNVRRVVGPDQVRVTSLGAAPSESLYSDSYGRKWQERVWAVPYLDVYIVSLLLPTPDGYTAVLLFTPSSLQAESKSAAHMLAGQLGVSLRGTLKQWQAYLSRRSLLPETLSGVKLEHAPDWTLRTRRFTSAVPAAVLALSGDSPLTMTMAFMKEGAQVVWDIADVWWDKDNRMDAAVGISRRENPPDSARLDLRNDFASRRERRAPFDGQLIRDSAETYSISQVLNVPGTGNGMISSDLVYELTLRLADHPTMQDAQHSLELAAETTHILERGGGAEMAAAPVVAPVANVEYDNTMRQAIAEAQKDDASVGKDIRGHLLSQDVRDLYEAVRTQAMQTPIGSEAASKAANEQMAEAQSLQAYWHQYPALSHNRDMWAEFLSRNGMPASTPHKDEVTAAENSLLSALGSGPPSPEWAVLAHALVVAYIQERRHMPIQANPAALDYRPRQTPCPAPAEKTSGKKSVIFSRMPRSLEDFWPLRSKQLGEEGEVKISLRISATGCALAAARVRSSGSDMMDEAVMQYYETIEFLPAEIDAKAVETTAVLPVVFKLRD
jgi:serine protease Do